MDSTVAAGELPREPDTTELPTRRLALRPEPFPLSVGECVVEDLLDIRGILVGVSFDKLEVGFKDDDGGSSFGSFMT